MSTGSNPNCVRFNHNFAELFEIDYILSVIYYQAQYTTHHNTHICYACQN